MKNQELQEQAKRSFFAYKPGELIFSTKDIIDGSDTKHAETGELFLILFDND